MKKKMSMVLVPIFSILLLVGCSEQTTSETKTPEPKSATQQSDAKLPQSIGLGGIDNARQLGGYKCADGKHVKKNVLLRTGKLVGATQEDINKLKGEYNLGTVIDFRAYSEIPKAQDPEIEGVDNIHIPVYHEGFDWPTREIPSDHPAANADGKDSIDGAVYSARVQDVQGQYLVMADSAYSQKAYYEFFKTLLKNEEGKSVLWHCSGGKDRTGFAAAFLLEILGVDRDTILKDFELSNEYRADVINKQLEAAKKAGYTDEKDIESLKDDDGVNTTYFKNTLNHIEKKYGSVYDYLINQVGITKEEVKQLQDMYLE